MGIKGRKVGSLGGWVFESEEGGCKPEYANHKTSEKQISFVEGRPEKSKKSL